VGTRQSHFSRSLAVVFATFAAVSSATWLGAQQSAPAAAPPAHLEPRTTSEEAKALFREALVESESVGGAPRIRRAADRALELDPQFALGRVYQAFAAAGTAEARSQAISDVMSGMGSAPAVEMLLALYWRESAAGRAAAAVPLLRAAVELVPGDPQIGYLYAQTQVVGMTVPEQVSLRREFVRRYPTHAAMHNTLAYQLFPTDPTAALTEVQEFVRLAPDHPNSHDSYADLLLLLRRPAEALPHVQREMELDPTFVAGPMKLGTIRLMMGDAPAARAEFARGMERFTGAADRLNFMHWTAATYAAMGDGKAALTEIAKSLATPDLTAAQTRLLHGRAAAIEAYLGDRSAVAAHLAAAGAGTSSAPRFQLEAIVYARIGDLAQARSAAAQYSSMVPATNLTKHTLNGLIALQSNDLETARTELAASAPNDLLAKALRADLMLRSGQRSEGTALRQEVVASTLKVDGNAPLDFFKLIARMHADKL
jgi:tetratricopeptide (TPR) repeat protein